MASSTSYRPGPSGAASIPRVILGSALGTMIEWYDFYLLGSLATVLSLKFYPPGNDTFALIAYLATFAVGFLVRPFGALFRRIDLPQRDARHADPERDGEALRMHLSRLGIRAEI